MGAKIAGRCWTCQTKGGPIILYRWRSQKGRRLFNANCPTCDKPLSITYPDLFKQKVEERGVPVFVETREVTR